MKKLLLIASALVTLSACSSKTEPSEANFGAAIDAYLAKKGALCLNDETWPVELNQMGKKLDSSFGRTSKSSRLEALASQGLATSSEMEMPVTSFTGKPTGRSIQVTRYELSDKGKSFFHETTGGYNKPDAGEIRGELCYGKKALDKVVKWEGPMKLGDYQEAGVKYFYKVVDLADWAKSPEIQAAFPNVKEWIDGAGIKQQSHGVRLTSEGWEANGIDRE